MGLGWGVYKASLDVYRNECAEAIEKAKQNYLSKLGTKLADSCTGQKTYWKLVNNLLNNLLNKCKVPRVPPLLIADLSQVANRRLFFLINSLSLNANHSTSGLPNFFLTTARLDTCER